MLRWLNWRFGSNVGCATLIHLSLLTAWCVCTISLSLTIVLGTGLKFTDLYVAQLWLVLHYGIETEPFPCRTTPILINNLVSGQLFKMVSCKWQLPSMSYFSAWPYSGLSLNVSEGSCCCYGWNKQCGVNSCHEALLLFHRQFAGDQHIKGLDFGCTTTPFGLKCCKRILKGTSPIHFSFCRQVPKWSKNLGKCMGEVH